MYIPPPPKDMIMLGCNEGNVEHKKCNAESIDKIEEASGKQKWYIAMYRWKMKTEDRWLTGWSRNVDFEQLKKDAEQWKDAKDIKFYELEY